MSVPGAVTAGRSFDDRAGRAKRWRLWIAAASWLLVVIVSVCRVIFDTFPLSKSWLLDWHVYEIGARQLLAHNLYLAPWPMYELMPTPSFNYPPLAAAWALPSLVLGGFSFIVLTLVANAVGVLAGLRAFRWPLAWAPVLLLAWLALWPWANGDVGLGNNNSIVFALVALFVWAHLTHRDRLAGVLLALAIGTKLWPAPLILVLLREGRGAALRWCVALLAVQLAAMILWLGPESILASAQAIVGPALPRTYAAGVPVLWTSYFRAAWSWWPAWGGYLVAVLLIAVPARGYLGLGFAILGGLALNPNLWDHYLFAFVLGLVVTTLGGWQVLEARLQLSSREWASLQQRGKASLGIHSSPAAPPE